MWDWRVGGNAHPLLILFLELLLVVGYEKATECAGVREILHGSRSQQGSQGQQTGRVWDESTFDRRSRLPKKRWTLLLMARWAGADTGSDLVNDCYVHQAVRGCDEDVKRAAGYERVCAGLLCGARIVAPCYLAGKVEEMAKVDRVQTRLKVR
jgi:hypothetical protein